MSKTIDERVVEMRFDNKQFESGVQTSLSTLDKLKKGLDLQGAAKGFDQLGTAAKKCDMSALSRSVETVQAKFSAFQVVAMTALSNITNSAINTGKQLLSSLTIEPITTGFNEYELKMGSIQTIMASTGESLDRVNQKLDELNTYSDKTIYSFSDMTQNIGKFTNAGVSLDQSVAAIQGVANVAAVSGANANEASRAMYNFGQAISSGYVKLIDWKSIELANMATVEFKQQLIDTALEMGTLVKVGDQYQSTTTDLNGKVSELFSTTTMFNDSLSSQWMTSEVLTATLGRYADETTEIGKKAFAAAQDVKTFSQLLDTLKESAQSGWAETWQLIVGDYEEAKSTLREFSEFFSNIIGSSAEARNELLGGALMSSWGQLKNRVSDAGLSVDTFRETLRETASETVDGLDQMIEEAGSFDAALSKGWLTTDILADTLDRMANEMTGTTEGISALSDEQLKSVGYTQEQVDALRALSDEAKNSSGEVAHLVETVGQKSGRELLFDSLLNAAKGIQKVFETLKGAWNAVFPPATSEQLYGIIAAINEFSKKLIMSDETADKLGRTFKGLFAVLDIIKQAFTAVFNALSPLLGGFGSLGGGILGVTASIGDWLVGISEAAKTGDIFNQVCQRISNFLQIAVSKIQSFVKAVKENFKFPGFELLHEILAGIQERMANVVAAATGMEVGVGTAIGAMGSALANSKFFQALQALWNGVKTIAGAIIDVFGGLASGIAEKLGDADFSGALDLLNSISFGAIAVGVTKFFNSVKAPFEGISSLLDEVRGCFKAYQNELQAGTLLKIAGAIGILAVSLVAIATIDSDKLTASLGAVTVLFTDLIGSMALFGKVSGNITGVTKSIAAMLAISTSVLILASALKKIADLDLKQLVTGLIGVAGLTAVIVTATKSLGNGSGAVLKGATQMVIFAGAIKILASACTDLADLSLGDLTKGLVGVGVLMAEVSLFMNTAKFSGKSVATATGIVILASAMKILASACEDFGKMKVGEIMKGLAAIGIVLLEISAFTKLTGNAKNVVATGLALIEIAAAMKIFASAMSDFGNLSWEEIGKGLLAMGVALAEVVVAMKLMPKNTVGIGIGLIAVGAALEIIADALGNMGSMSWEEIAKGLVTLGVALAELAIGLNFMQGTLAGSAALLVAAAALAIFTPSLILLGSMSWEGIAKGLIAIAGAFTVLGVAGALLTPLVPTILGLSGALALISVGVVGLGAGLLVIGTGLSAIAVGITALATSLGAGVTVIVAGLTAIITGVAALIPAIAEKLGEAVVAFCNVFIDGIPAIGEAVKTLVITLVDVLVECVPAIADGAMELVAGVLAALVSYTPQIVDSVFQFLIAILEGIARNIPQLITAAMEVIGAFFAGVLNALSNIDSETLIQGVAAIGLLTALVAALGAVAGLIPAAMAGVLGMGVVIAELALVLAAIGGLAQIPGLEWLISEGGQLLQTIGTAIGGLVGGIVGGFMSGVSSSFPQIGADLSAFMANVQPFIDGASSIGPDMITGVRALTEAIILITAADLLEGLTSWLTGGSSLADFAEDLVPFGEAMMAFSNSIRGLDGDLVSTAAIAGKTLAEMADTLPNTGGVVGFFAGENDMGAFGDQLVGFGQSMMDFAESIKGLDIDAVQNAATAGKAMAEMAATLPNTGGVVGFFAGENDMDAFGEQLVPFGQAIKEYSLAVAGLDVDAVVNSATAGQALVELANTVPNTGGAVAFFTGDNDLATFGEQIVVFGHAMNEYSQTVSGIDGEAVANSATAGAALVELANTIPNTGGLVSFFTGDNDLATFGEQLIPFGESMKAYSDAIAGINVEAVTASATAALTLAELQSTLPNVGGVVAFFTGGNDLGTFGEGIKTFGEAMKSYGLAVSGMDTEAVTASATAAQSLAQLQASLPNVGGLVSFFTGDNDLGTFAEGLIPFGAAMKSYGQAVSGIDADSITASAIAAQSLAELQAALPNVGGVMEFFTGGNDLGTFATGIIPFGAAMKSYGEAVSEINADAITASAIAAQSLAQLQTTLPAVGGVMEFFTGGNDLATFAAGIVPFGAAMKSYGQAVADINTDSITASAIAAQSLAELQSTLPQIGGVMEFFTGGNDLATFGATLIPFGEAMNAYGAAVSGIDTAAVVSSATAGQALVELAKTLPNCGGLIEVFTGSSSLATFGDEIIAFGQDLAAYAEAISGVKPEVVTASANAAQALSSLASGLPDSSLFDQWFGGDQTLSAFGDEIEAFGADMADYYSEVASIDLTKLSGVVSQVWSLVDLANGVQGVSTSGLTTFSNALKTMADAGITEFTAAFENSSTRVNNAVGVMLSSVGTSITNSTGIITPSMETLMVSLAQVVTDKAAEINTSVTTMMTGVATTIRNSAPSVKSATQTVLTGAVTTINSMNSQFVAAGQSAGQGLVNGIKSMLGSSSAAGRSLALAALNAAKRALDSHSPSREFIYLGENIGEGLAIGVNNGIVPASQATSDMIDEVISVSSKGIDAFQEWADEKKYYGELSLKDELAGYEQLQKMYAAGSEERIKIDREVYRIQNELVAATYQYSLDWIEQEKYYKRLSTEEELAAYERMQARYIEGSEERMAIDRKIFDLRNQLMDESYQHSMDWIEEEKYYGRMSLADELAAYKRVQSRYAKGTEERKKMDREVYRLEQEIYEAQEQYIADVQRVQTEANQKRLDLEEEYADKVTSINERLASDIKSLNDEYQNALESRENSLYQSYGLFDEVQEKEEVSGDTLMKNLNAQVQEFGEWQDLLDNLSKRGVDDGLIGELQEMGPSAIAEIKALNSMSDSELDKYTALWSIKHAQAREQAVGELEGLRIETQQNIAQLRIDAEIELDEYRAVWQDRMNQVTIDADRELEELRRAFGEKVGLIKKDTEQQTQEMADAAQAILEEAGWSETGQQIVAGITEGVNETKPLFLDALTQMALEGVQAVADTLEINSPSKVFQELGGYTGLGFVQGLSDYANKSYDAGASVAGYATDGLSNVISTISGLVDSEFDMQPTIRPVIDFTDVSRGANEVNSLFASAKLLALAGQTSFAFNSTMDGSGMTVTVDNNGVIEELRSLRSEMAEMTERLERMQVVLDTGTLVGELSDPIDNALGQKQALRGRGI